MKCLKNISGLENLKVLAIDRIEWKDVSKIIYKTTEAETGDSEMN